MRKLSAAAFGAGLLAAAGLLVLPATMPASAATVPATSVSHTVKPSATCTTSAYDPVSGGEVRGYATLSCTSSEDIQVQACLQQLITGGWVDVVGGCQTSQEVYGTYTSATGKSYYPTCGRYYRTKAVATVNGSTGSPLYGNGYQGC